MQIGLAFIVGQLSLGGAEQQLYYFLSGLDRSRFRPLVISLGPTPHEYWEQPILRLDVPVRHVTRCLGPVLRTFRIAAILRAHKVQIVHGWVFHSNPYSALAGSLANVSIRLGSMREAYAGLPNERFLRWLGYRGLDVLITNSANTARQVQALELTKARVQVVPNGVPIPEPLYQSERGFLKARLGFSSSDLLIGSIGRLDENKNYVMLLQAFAPLIQEWPDLRLVIIGDGPMKPKLAAMAESLGVTSRLNLTGSIPQAAKYLPVIDVCCLTSYTEGMPNLVMEAAAAGLPVISTCCGDTADLIEHDVSGYLVAPGDTIKMTAYLSALLANPERRFRMGTAGRDKMRRQYSVAAMVERISQVYEEVLAEKGPVPAIVRPEPRN